MQHVRVTKSGDTLRIDLGTFARPISAMLEATITMPELYDLEVSGACHGTISGFNSSEDLNIEVSGASKVEGDITAGNTNFDISGASTLELEGTAGDMDAEVSGASRLNLDNFTAKPVLCHFQYLIITNIILVKFINNNYSWNTMFISISPDNFRSNLYTGHGINKNNSQIISL